MSLKYGQLRFYCAVNQTGRSVHRRVSSVKPKPSVSTGEHGDDDDDDDDDFIRTMTLINNKYKITFVNIYMVTRSPNPRAYRVLEHFLLSVL